MVHHCLSGSKLNFSVWNWMRLVFWPLNSFLVLSPTIFFEKTAPQPCYIFFFLQFGLLPPPTAACPSYPGDGISQHGLVPRTNASPRAAGCALPRAGHLWTLTWTSNIYMRGKRVCGRGRRMATKSLTAEPLLISDTEIISGQRVWR